MLRTYEAVESQKRQQMCSRPSLVDTPALCHEVDPVENIEERGRWLVDGADDSPTFAGELAQKSYQLACSYCVQSAVKALVSVES